MLAAHMWQDMPDAASNCYLHKGMHADVNGSALMQVTIASCIGHILPHMSS